VIDVVHTNVLINNLLLVYNVMQ